VQGFGNLNGRTLRHDVLLRDDAIRSVGKRGAGEDAKGFAGPQRSLGDRAGRDTASERKLRRYFGASGVRVGRPQRVAVHGRVGPGWDVTGGDEIL
jgi:hypothetical protein